MFFRQKYSHFKVLAILTLASVHGNGRRSQTEGLQYIWTIFYHVYVTDGRYVLAADTCDCVVLVKLTAKQSVESRLTKWAELNLQMRCKIANGFVAVTILHRHCLRVLDLEQT